MKKTAAIYFSGNGNTKYAVEVLASKLGVNQDNILSIEENEDKIKNTIINADTIIIAYPIILCYIPKILSDFIIDHLKWFEGKKILTLVTQACFSFDGGVLVFRLLKKHHIPFKKLSNIHIKMPIVVCDMKLINPTKDEEIIKLKNDAYKKLDECSRIILNGGHIHDGSEWARPIAFLRQRMFYLNRIKNYYKGVKINNNCIKCGLCINCCPMKNFVEKDGIIESEEKCIQCYRCANRCPQNAITIWGKNIQWKYKGLEKY
jgi:NAD-dependent dihydropyrimidine dehydrogenase PreA subunit